ncbi:hypothetical protein LFL96_21335 [Paraburkholderia sp. D15]|uniref:hypothetical protein n=1 Tax=Paraburkholderia sp. D15 TaxID=2880218 RepID=UPI00247A93E8|nr:hypothetical protein [Paraburkholderia sp. D15]WGS53604.1 hypothetical protein LFL96_21335 [Paraburkholderia sp. D15]
MSAERKMRRFLAAGLCLSVLAGCAVEGIGFDGRRDALMNADRAGRDYEVLHSGARDSAWYAGWCNVVLPHFDRMNDAKDRVIRYCGAMQAQPENAAMIQKTLADDLSKSWVISDAQAQRNAMLGAAMIQRQAKPAPLNCTSNAVGNTVNTSCY